MYIDSHAHLYADEYRNDLEAVLDRAREAGVTHIIVPGTDLATSRAALALAERVPWIYATVGVHPHDAAKAVDEDLKEIEDLSRHPKVVAIGEIGLDYYYDFSPRERQREIMASQVEIAARRALPIVVHTRESLEDTLAIVEEAVKRHPAWLPSEPAAGSDRFPLRGVFHCFPGTSAQARRLRSLGFAVSYPGIVTFKKSSALVTLLEFGFQNILLETDSPYMAPVPLRGQRNEPAHVVLIGRMIASAFGVPERDVAAATSANAVRLFRLPPIPG